MPAERPSPEHRHFAGSLRSQLTDCERLLCRRLRNRGLAGFKFRRQHPWPPYVLDFYCAELRLVIELDGGQHHDAAGLARDQLQRIWSARGWRGCVSVIWTYCRIWKAF